MNENQAERLVVAFESIAVSLEKWYNASHPPKAELKPVKVTTVKTDEELHREAEESEPIENWTRLGEEDGIGHYEREFIAKKAK